MPVLDTNILVSLLKGDERAKEKVSSLTSAGSAIFVTTITAYELLKGASISSRPEENLAKVRDLLYTIPVLELSTEACEQASKIYKDLRARGKMIGEFDILIAAIVMSRDEEEPLVTKDAHFKNVEGLRMDKW
jgi:tRNA(fMet)-specific endonuclease VapC